MNIDETKSDIQYINSMIYKLGINKNFESIYNLQEFGFTFPCGLIIIGEEYTVTNHIYYNCFIK